MKVGLEIILYSLTANLLPVVPFFQGCSMLPALFQCMLTAQNNKYILSIGSRLKTMLEFNIYYSHNESFFQFWVFYFNVSLLSSFCAWKTENAIIITAFVLNGNLTKYTVHASCEILYSKTKHPGLDDFQNLVSKIFSDFRMLPSYLLSSMYNLFFVAHNNQISIRFLFTCKNKRK